MNKNVHYYSLLDQRHCSIIHYTDIDLDTVEDLTSICCQILSRISYSGVGERGGGGGGQLPLPTFWTCLHLIKMKEGFFIQYVNHKINVEQLNQNFLSQIAPEAVSEHENAPKNSGGGGMPPNPTKSQSKMLPPTPLFMTFLHH